MALTNLKIVNMALSKIGAKTITDFSDKSDIQLEDTYNHIRDKLLMRHPWNFAQARDTIEPNDDAPDFEWDYEYDLPYDYLGNATLYESDADFKIEGNTLLCNDNIIYLKYTAQITDVSAYSPLFIELLILELASELAITISNDQVMKDRLLLELEQKFLDNAVTNVNEGYVPEAEEETTWQSTGH